MAELGFQDHNGQLTMRTGFRGARDASPDSVIFSADSNFSLFSSSASCSVDRCSFASDVHEHDSLSEISQHLAVHECHDTSSSGPDLDPNKSKKSPLCRKVEKAKVQKEHSEVETEDENQVLDSARSSFSQALKDCQVRRSRSEAKKLDRRRPASLDLNNTVTNVTSSSPRFGVMKKNSVLTRRTDTFPSPGTPNYRQTNVGIQKGWSSERVPLHTSVNRRNVNNALLPFNNGRTLPSKWEDAERWIFSPVSGDGAVRSSFPQPQRRPKSKSGPLGPPGSAYYSMYSPAVHMFDGGNAGNLIAASPFTAGVIAADSFSIRHDGRHGGNGNFPACMEPCMGRSVSIHGCSEMLCPSILLSSHDEKLDGVEDEANNVSRAVSRRDMATQMSSEGSPHSSPRERPSFSPSPSPSPSALPIVEFHSFHSSKQEVRDVQIDERVTMTRWSKKHRARNAGKSSGNVDDWKSKALEVRSTNWEVSETAKRISKVQREEARITAWENLQKAKAEAAIRKLEMKLEKKRSSSMDKIMNKLRSGQRKAQQMRSSVAVNQAQVVRTSQKVIPFRRTRQIVSLSGCFTCHFRTSSNFQCSLGKCFPPSKSVLIKYKDNDEDLVTITCTSELRLAESSVDSLMPKEPETDKSDLIGLLRLHIVEVSLEQEPPILEEEEEESLESEGIKGGDESGSHSSLGDSVAETVETEVDSKTEKAALVEKPAASEDLECKEVEMDDWLFEFAQLFRTHVGIDPDAHIDLHELGMELCSEVLEETVTSEEAQSLFDKAALKFQEVAALAYFNWGNVHMCAARKRIPIDDSAAKDLVASQLQAAYDWVKEKYSLAKEKYEEALLIKPDFYEGLLALGQQQFEMAKLHWSYVLAKKENLSKWDPAETIKLFDSAEEKMRSAAEMWEKLEEQRAKELKDPSSSKREELLKRKKKQASGNEGAPNQVEISSDEAVEQAAVMQSQIHLFWGNMLFERSQVECKLGLTGWKKNLDTAVERFKLAGASEVDISTVLKNHSSNGDAAEGNEKKVENPSANSVIKADSDNDNNQISGE